MVIGRSGPLQENWGALEVALVTVSEAFPLLVAVTVRVLLLPITTLLKSSAELLSVN